MFISLVLAAMSEHSLQAEQRPSFLCSLFRIKLLTDSFTEVKQCTECRATTSWKGEHKRDVYSFIPLFIPTPERGPTSLSSIPPSPLLPNRRGQGCRRRCISPCRGGLADRPPRRRRAVVCRQRDDGPVEGGSVTLNPCLRAPTSG